MSLTWKAAKCEFQCRTWRRLKGAPGHPSRALQAAQQSSWRQDVHGEKIDPKIKRYHLSEHHYHTLIDAFHCPTVHVMKTQVHTYAWDIIYVQNIEGGKCFFPSHL